tara:strand:- start:406 stop:513 length:108 start_codon:yes stop_codon:yes gene_type:complete
MQLISEIICAASIFLMPVVAIYGYYALTGEFMEFM